jgi:regulator of sigma E protease
MTGFAAIALLVLVFSFVNLVHAAARLAAARLVGVAVNRISLGVGPTLWSRIAGETTYRVALLPVGLVVRLRPPWTRDAAGVWPPSSPRDLRGRSGWVRLAVFAAPLAAVLLVALASAYWLNGFETRGPSEEPVIGRVEEGGPAARAGIAVGDRVVAVSGRAVGSWEELRAAVLALDADVTEVRVQRGAETVTLEVHPVVLPQTQRRALGVFRAEVVKPAPGPVARVCAAFRSVKDGLGAYAGAIRRSFAGERVTVGGPIAVFQDAEGLTPDDRSRRLAALVTFTVLQWLVACLVLPYLDGVRLLFLGIEAAARRPLHPRHERWLNRGWLAVYVLLNVLAIAGRVGGA